MGKDLVKISLSVLFAAGLEKEKGWAALKNRILKINWMKLTFFQTLFTLQDNKYTYIYLELEQEIVF